MSRTRAAAGRLARLTTAAAAVALLSLACGGGGGRGGGGGGPTEPQPSIVYTPGSGGGAGSLSLVQGAGTTSRRLVLELRAEEVPELYGVAFDLEYPSAVLAFEGAGEGSFLSAGGAATSLQVAEGPRGNLVLGLTRLGLLPGVGGSGVLLTLELSASGTGGGSFRFVDPRAFDASGDPIADLTWSAGTVQVRM